VSNSHEDGHLELQIGGLPLKVPVVVTEQLGAAAGASTPATGAPSAVIERQLRNVLGWTPKPADTPGLVRALEKSFTAREENGATRWYYTPRGTAIPLEAAEITGAQGSLYLRATGAIDDMLVLLDGLEPMREEAADEDAVEAIRAIVRCTLSEIVNEIGREGGPSVTLVDSLFTQLLGVEEDPDKVETDPKLVDGDVARVRDRFYFDSAFISGLPDETNFTKFLTFVDFATSLRSSWVRQRAFFAGTSGQAFFGPQLTKLRRILESVGQNVEEVYLYLDLVGIDQTERQTLETDSLFLQPTLEWVQGYVTETAPRLVDEAGRDGAASLLPNLAAMADAVDKFISPNDDFPTLYDTPLVFATLQSLQRGLVAAAEIVQTIGPGPGAHVLTLRQETVPPVDVPDPDETGSSPLVVTVSGVEGVAGPAGPAGPKGPAGPAGPVSHHHNHYTMQIADVQREDVFLLQDADTGTEYTGVLSEHEGRHYADFDFVLATDEPSFYNLIRVRKGKPKKTLMTIPTSRASSAQTPASQ